MSQLIQASEEGAHLNDEELRATAGLVLAAGFETTVNLLGNGIRLLLDTPDQLAQLRQRPQRWPNAVEEILRLESPVQLSARICRRERYRVVDLTDERGNLAAFMLAGLGADVVLVEPPQGSGGRRRGPFAGDGRGPRALADVLGLEPRQAQRRARPRHRTPGGTAWPGCAPAPTS